VRDVDAELHPALAAVSFGACASSTTLRITAKA
jgi:hypothetical protein